MAKKKVTERPEGIFSVAPEDLTIVWQGAFYNFVANNPVVIPDGLFDYLSKHGKVTAVATEVEEVVIEEPTIPEPEVVEVVEEPTEEVI